jgi:hypothetical protein
VMGGRNCRKAHRTECHSEGGSPAPIHVGFVRFEQR